MCLGVKDARTEIQDHYTLTDWDGRFLVHITEPNNEMEVQVDRLGIVELIQDEENNVLETDDEIEEIDEEEDMRDRNQR